MGYLILFVMIFLFLKSKIYNMLLLLIFVSISIPSNLIIENLLRVNVISIIDTKKIILICLFFLLFVGVVTKKIIICFDKSDFFFLIFSSIVFIYILIGFNNHNIFIIQDTRIYMTFILTYFVGKAIIRNNPRLNMTMKIIMASSLVFSLITIIIFLFGKSYLPEIYGIKLLNWWGDRVTFSNTSILIVTISISFYSLLSSKYKFINCIIICLGIWSILISQTRSLIIFTIFNLIFIFLIYFFKKSSSRKGLSIKVLISFLMVFTLSLTFFIFSEGQYKVSNNKLANDIISRFSSGTDSLEVRNKSNEVILENISQNPLGFGLGKEMVLYGDNFTENSEGIYLDNSFITVLNKMGIFGLVCFVLILIYLPIRVLSTYRKTKNEYYLLFLLLYPSFIITSAVLSAQILYSTSVSVFFLVIYILMTQTSPMKIKN